MVELQKKVLAALTNLVPGDAVLGGGAGFAVLLIAVFFVGLVWQAALKDLLERIYKWLQEKRRGLLVVAVLLPVLVSIAVASIASAVAMLAVGLLAGLFSTRARARIGLFAALQVVLLSTSLLIENYLRGQDKLRHDERDQVFVVLALQPHASENLDQLVSLSKQLRDTFSSVFGGLAQVKIEPLGFSDRKDLDDWKELPAVVDRLLKKDIQADVVLVNRARLVPGEVEFLTFLLRVNIHGTDPAPAFSEVGMVQGSGRLASFPYLVLRAELKIVEELRKSPRFVLPAPEDERLRRNILRSYQEFLALDESVPEAVIEAIEAAQRSDRAPSYPDLTEILALYPKGEEDELKEVLFARTRGNLGKWGEPPAPAPAPVPGPTVAVPPAAVANVVRGRSVS